MGRPGYSEVFGNWDAILAAEHTYQSDAQPWQIALKFSTITTRSEIIHPCDGFGRPEQTKHKECLL